MTRCYAWPLTVREGDDLELFVSTGVDRFGIQLFRWGRTVEAVGPAPGDYEGRDVPLGRPDEGWGWPKYAVPLGAQLADGVYVAVPVPLGPDGAPEPVPADTALLTRRDAGLFVLRRDPPSPGRILFKLPTATYGAYNQLGGMSLYAGAHWVRDWSGQGYVVSLQRPGNGGVGGRVMEGDAPDVYARRSRRQVFAHWDAPFVAWLEGAGYQASYCTDFDLNDDPSLLDGASVLLSAGHDEYWSVEMRRRVLEFVDRGGNAAFFGGDLACFVIEIAAGGDRMFCGKMAGGGPDGGTLRPGALWHADDPEDWLTLASGAYGGGWWDGRRAIDAYQPVVAEHWAFDGVDFPAEGISGGEETPIIGYETDGVALERASDPPRMRAAAKGGAGGRVLLAVAKLSSGWVAGYDQANAAMMIRTARSGGIVYSTGTTDWPLALASDSRVSRITDNVVARLAQRSLLIHGPTYPDGEYLGEGDVVGPGQVVSWYLDGGQLADEGLEGVEWEVQGGDVVIGSALGLSTAAPSEGWLTVTARGRDADGAARFGTRTVRVLPEEEYLQRRIIRALHAMANPDEQGGALVDQKASEAELAGRVIPVRLQWVKEHAQVLAELLATLESIWERQGRMADASLRADEK